MDRPHTLTGPLDLDRIRQAGLTEQPWPHSVIDSVIRDPDTLHDLVSTFPTAGFQLVKQPEPDEEGKTLALEIRNDIGRADLDPAWKALLKQLHSDAYRQAVEHLTGVSLTDSQRRVAFYRVPPHAWLGVHRDKPNKIVSHIFYFNDDWEAGIGGDLLILDRPDLTRVRRRIAPVAGTSVVVVRGDDSWHAVEKVSAAVDRARCSIIVVFHPADADLSYYET